MTTPTIPASPVRAQVLTPAEYDDLRIRQTLRDRLRERGRPAKGVPVLRVIAAAGARSAGPAPRWPAAARMERGGLSPEKPSKLRGDSAEEQGPGMSPLAARVAYLTTPGHPSRRAGLHGGIERVRGGPAWWGDCWTPSVFGALGRIPGVRVIRETPSALRVRLERDALRPVVELFGFRAPARAVEALLALQRRARRATACRRAHAAAARPEPVA